MRHLKLTPGRAFWIVCAFFLLLPRAAAAAESSLEIDFDGDGRRDLVALSRQEPTVVHVWLSASNTRQTIHTGAPLLRIAAADLDGDRRPELIAADSALQIHVWAHAPRGLRSYRPRDGVPPALMRPDRRSVDNGREPASAITGAPAVPVTATLSASPHPPAPGSVACAPRQKGTGRSFRAFDPLVPRPPPTHVSR